jgi:hypothetical protein
LNFGAVLEALQSLGTPLVVAAVAVYLLLRGEIEFRYPSRRREK